MVILKLVNKNNNGFIIAIKFLRNLNIFLGVIESNVGSILAIIFAYD